MGVEEANAVFNASEYKQSIDTMSPGEMEKMHAHDQSEYQGVPVTVNPVIRTNTEGDTDLGLNMRVGSDNVSVIKNKASLSNQ